MRFPSRKWLAFAVALVILVSVTLLLVFLRTDFQERENAALQYFSRQEGMSETFAQLEQLTTPSATVLCWWDYGRAVREWSHREAIEAFPSREIWHTVGSSRDPWHNFEAQLFGTWGSAERIHDLARMFMLPEEESLSIMRSYNVSHVLVFNPDELHKFPWIAEIAGYNATEYLIKPEEVYQPTASAAQVTLLRLLFDDTLPPQFFTKLFDNDRGKIYQVNYP